MLNVTVAALLLTRPSFAPVFAGFRKYSLSKLGYYRQVSPLVCNYGSLYVHSSRFKKFMDSVVRQSSSSPWYDDPNMQCMSEYPDATEFTQCEFNENEDIPSDCHCLFYINGGAGERTHYILAERAFVRIGATVVCFHAGLAVQMERRRLYLCIATQPDDSGYDDPVVLAPWSQVGTFSDVTVEMHHRPVNKCNGVEGWISSWGREDQRILLVD